MNGFVMYSAVLWSTPYCLYLGAKVRGIPAWCGCVCDVGSS